MKVLVTMGCMLAAMFYPMFASTTNALISAAAVVEGAQITAKLIGAIERGIPPQASAQPEPQGRFDVAQSAAAPTIAALSPTSGPIGTLVTILGANFTSTDNVIHFRGEHDSFDAGSPVGSENGTSLQFQISTCPSYQPRCPGRYVSPGVYKVTVINVNGASNEATFTLTAR